MCVNFHFKQILHQTLHQKFVYDDLPKRSAKPQRETASTRPERGLGSDSIEPCSHYSPLLYSLIPPARQVGPLLYQHQSKVGSGPSRDTHHAPAGPGWETRAPVFPAHVVAVDVHVEHVHDVLLGASVPVAYFPPTKVHQSCQRGVHPSRLLKVQREFGCRAHHFYCSSQAGLSPGRWTRASLGRASYVPASRFGK